MPNVKASSQTKVDLIENLAIKFVGGQAASLINQIKALPLKLPNDNTYYIVSRGETIEIFTQDFGIKNFKYEGSGSVDYNDEKIEITNRGMKLVIFQSPRSLDTSDFKPLEEHLAPVALMEEFAQETDPIKRRELIEKIRVDFVKKTPAPKRVKSPSYSSGSSGGGESSRWTSSRPG